MIGNYRINLGAGIVGFILTFFVAYSSNVFVTSLIRGFIGFVVWFVLAYGLRWVLGVLLAPSPEHNGFDVDSLNNQAVKGSQMDITLEGDGEELNDLLKNGQNASAEADLPTSENTKTDFTPLNPPKLVRTKEPEELAQAVRHLTDK
ncbi:hypothetical protein [Paenibacillus hubeiensis]|uniref:hypothetical protein n=1 Tax=Paenibacillus hubeiensis TaxID=3077330 RepID=UPI0031BA5DB1